MLIHSRLCHSTPSYSTSTWSKFHLISTSFTGERGSTRTYPLYSPLLGPDLFFSFVIFFHTDGRTSWKGDQPVARPLPSHRTALTHNKHTQRSMPWVGFEPTIPVFERAKTVHVWDRAAIVIGAELLTFFVQITSRKGTVRRMEWTTTFNCMSEAKRNWK
jgi:hypothetical protein